jgi:hypothetical protein
LKNFFALIAVAALFAAANLQAERGGAPDVTGCLAELQADYGREVQVEIVSKRRQRYGTRVRMAVRLDADNTEFATCWVPVDAIAILEVDDSEGPVAGSKAAEAGK